MSVTRERERERERERAPWAECAIKRGKRNLSTAQKALRPRELSGEAATWEARWVGPVGPVPGEISNGETDFDFQLILDFDKNLANFTRRFIRNLDMRIFPKIF
jgi:hypothetical protein